MQKSYSFDKETIKKIGRGLLIAMTGGAAIAGLDYLGMVQIDNPLIAALVAWLVPSLTNTVREWVKGEGV